MKTKIIETSKARILVLVLPEKAKIINAMSANDSLIVWFESPEKYGYQNIVTPNGNWSVLGFLNSLTEEQMRMVVDDYNAEYFKKRKKYVNYNREHNLHLFFITAYESFSSLLAKHEINLANPLGEKPEYFTSQNTATNQITWSDLVDEWQAEQDKVYTNAFVLIEEKEVYEWDTFSADIPPYEC